MSSSPVIGDALYQRNGIDIRSDLITLSEFLSKEPNQDQIDWKELMELSFMLANLTNEVLNVCIHHVHVCDKRLLI